MYNIYSIIFIEATRKKHVFEYGLGKRIFLPVLHTLRHGLGWAGLWP